MKKAQKLLTAGSLWALFVIIMALASARASAQPCCDLIIDIAPNTPCCINIVQTLWSDGWHTGGTYCNPVVPVRIPVPCPNDLIAITIQTSSGPRLIEAGVTNVPVRISDDCCVLVSVARNLPCNLIRITPVAC